MRQYILAITFSVSFLAQTAMAGDSLKVGVSIKPIHSIVSAVMEGVESPFLIVEGSGSPHTYNLKPSQAQKLQDANIIFWMGNQLEPALAKPIHNIARDAVVINLLKTHDLITWQIRETDSFEKHDHDEHQSDHGHKEHGHKEHGHKEHGHKEHGHKEHGHKEHGHKEHGHKEHGHKEHGHKEHGHKEHGHEDPHIWLDPVNAKILARAVKHRLIEIDPLHADLYTKNTLMLENKLDQLLVNIEQQLHLIEANNRNFIVFHDAYQYFEKRFGFSAVGSVTISPEIMPGAKKIVALRNKIAHHRVHCIFSEPQFQPKIINRLVEDTDVNVGILDPLGADIPNGPELYHTLIKNMAASFLNCLSKRKSS